MRHSRRAVMTEHYKLYLKKNIFNGRYFVRNVQIGICTAAVGLLVAGAAGVATLGNASGATEARNTVKEALFGTAEDTESTEAVMAAENTLVETVMVQADTAELVTEEQTEAEQDVILAVRETPVQETTEEKSEFDGKCIANVEETLNIRKEPSTDAEFVGSMSNGAIALVEGTEGEWTKIKSGEVEGYVLTEYILTGENAEELAEEHVTLVGTVLEDGVNVRMEQSTDSDILTVLDKDAKISVLGCAAKEDAQDGENNDEQPSEEAPAEEESTEEENTEQVSEQDGEQADTEAVETVTEQTEEAGADTEAAEAEKASDAEVLEASTEKLPSITGAVEEITAEAEQKAEDTETEKETENQAEAAAQDITWLPVMLEDGQVGYVSAELVDVDRLYELAVSAEELERKAREEEEARRAAEEEAARQAQEAARQAQEAAASSYESNSYDGGSSDSGSSSSSYSGETVTPVTASSSGECLGTFTLTAYCGCSKCSGGHNLTATGTTPAEGRTIAADPSVLPYGTQVVIDGVVYTVEDCGSGVCGNHIDIFCATHDSALAFGRRTAKVYKY